MMSRWLDRLLIASNRKRVKNAEQELRIESLCVAGGPAEVKALRTASNP